MRFKFRYWINGKPVGSEKPNINPMYWNVEFDCFDWTANVCLPGCALEITENNSRTSGIIGGELLQCRRSLTD